MRLVFAGRDKYILHTWNMEIPNEQTTDIYPHSFNERWRMHGKQRVGHERPASGHGIPDGRPRFNTTVLDHIRAANAGIRTHAAQVALACNDPAGQCQW